MVKKIAAILLLALFLLSSTEAYQLTRLPVVFKHFAVHHRENSRLSFVAFLAMHYLHGSPKDKDYNEDMKLPFKTADKCAVNVLTALVPASLSIPVSIPAAHSPAKIPIHNERSDLLAYLSHIWQPPKTC